MIRQKSNIMKKSYVWIFRLIYRIITPGQFIDTDEEKFYSAPEKEQSEGILFQSDFRALRKVTFHNLKIDMNCDIFLKNCQQVCFKDCDITGGDHRIKLFFVRECLF